MYYLYDGPKVKRRPRRRLKEAEQQQQQQQQEESASTFKLNASQPQSPQHFKESFDESESNMWDHYSQKHSLGHARCFPLASDGSLHSQESKAFSSSSRNNSPVDEAPFVQPQKSPDSQLAIRKEIEGDIRPPCTQWTSKKTLPVQAERTSSVQSDTAASSTNRTGKRKGNSTALSEPLSTIDSSDDCDSQVAVSGVDNETDEKWMESVAERFPEGEHRTRIARYLQSQQEAYKLYQMRGTQANCSPKPTQSKKTDSGKVSTESTADTTDPGSSSDRNSRTMTDVRTSLEMGERNALPNAQRVSRFISSQGVLLEKYEIAFEGKGNDYTGQKKGHQGTTNELGRTKSQETNPTRSEISTGRLRHAEDTDTDILRQPGKPKRGVVCQCCFEEARTCLVCSTGVHSFCRDCMTRYVEGFVFGEPYLLKESDTCKVLPCMASDCQDGFIPHDSIRLNTKPRVWEAYQEKIFHVSALSSFDDEDSSDRGYSSNHEIPRPAVDPTATTAVVTPPAASVSGSADNVDRCYRRIEEAMTAAKLRRCPNCTIPFLKESGYCNKIRCPSCRIAVCYMCNQRVPSKGYEHFCVHGYDVCPIGCGKCVLWTNHDEANDREKLRSLVHSEANRLWEQSLVSTPEAATPVDVDRLLSDP